MEEIEYWIRFMERRHTNKYLNLATAKERSYLDQPLKKVELSLDQPFLKVEYNMDIDLLLKALDNDDNEQLMKLTTKKIKQLKMSALNELELDHNKLLDFLEKLKMYRYVDAMNELNYGSYIRWINISNPAHIILSRGGIFCDLNITDNGVYVVCKGFTHKHFKIKLDECLIFQKLKDQELVLLSALDHISQNEI